MTIWAREVLILIKWRKIPIEFDFYIQNEFDSIILQNSLFLTFCYYNIIDNLDFYYREDESDEAIELIIFRDN